MSAYGWCLGKSYQYGIFTSGYTPDWTALESDASTKYNSYDNDTGIYKYEHFVEMATGASDNTKLKNIYDMAGNMYEWSTEYGYYDNSSDNMKCAIIRGGSFYHHGYDAPVSARGGSTLASIADSPVIGFRLVLYVK